MALFFFLAPPLVAGFDFFVTFVDDLANVDVFFALGAAAFGFAGTGAGAAAAGVATATGFFATSTF